MLFYLLCTGQPVGCLCAVIGAVSCSTGYTLFYWLCAVLGAMSCSTGYTLFYWLCAILQAIYFVLVLCCFCWVLFVCYSTGYILFYWLCAILQDGPRVQAAFILNIFLWKFGELHASYTYRTAEWGCNVVPSQNLCGLIERVCES